MTRAVAIVLLLLAASPAFPQDESPQPAGAARDREDILRAQRDYDAGRYAAAIRGLEGLHARHAGDGATHALLGHSLFMTGRTAEARAELVEALARGRVSSDVLLRLAEIDRGRGDHSAALQDLLVAGILLPEDKTLPVATADAAAQAGLAAVAEQEYEEALRRSPDSVDTLLRLGNLYVRAGRNDDALEAFRTAEALGAENVTRLVAELYLARGDRELAAAAYERLLVEQAEDPELELRCAELLLAAGNPEEAARRAGNVAAAASGDLAARAHVLLGQTKVASGDIDGAVREWREAVEAGAESPELSGFLGMHFHRAGDHEKAVRYLRDAVRQGGPDRERQTALVESLIGMHDLDAARTQAVALIEEFGLDDRVERLITRLAKAAAERTP